MDTTRFTLLDASGAPLAADADVATAVAVLDNTHQLIWSRDTLGERDDDDDLCSVTHADAERHVAQLDLAGATDWRLPTIQELLTLVDYSRYAPAIDTGAFPDTQSDWYWTSTSPAAGSPSCAWIVDFDDGYARRSLRDYDAFVRAVRSVASSSVSGQ